jgi:hypothetical protein
MVPVSPATRISTAMPVSLLNAWSASFIDVSASGNESYVTNVMAAGSEVEASSLEHAPTTNMRATAADAGFLLVISGSLSRAGGR